MNFDTYTLEGNKDQAILLIHGLTATPLAVRPLADELNATGYTVHVPLLAGHGTHPKDLLSVHVADWYENVEENVKFLANNYNTVYVVGISMGANLAFHAAARFPDIIKKIVAVGTPIYLKRELYIRLGSTIFPLIKDFHKKSNPDQSYFETTGTYSVWPYHSLKELLKLIKNTKQILPSISTPILSIQAENDPIVHKNSLDQIISNLATPADKKHFLLLGNGGHIPVLGYHKQQSIEATLSFLNQ